MRVLHVIPSISPLRGGPSVAALEMVAALRRASVDARILTTDDHGPGSLGDLPIGAWSDHLGVPVLAFRRWAPPLSALREFAFSPGLSRWLRAHGSDFDLLHVHALFSFPATSAMAFARAAGIPYVVSTIGQLCVWSLQQRSLRKRLYLFLQERANLEAAAALHFTTTTERDEARLLGLTAPALVLPLGVKAPSGLPGPEAAPPVRFLFLSRLHPKKRLEVLLDALALLQARAPRAAWQLAIAGDGDADYVEALRRRADDLQLGERCHWLGFLEGRAKWEALAAAHWFVLPSASENFGIAAIEALAVGTPPILSPQVAIASQIQAAGAGWLVPGEVEPLAERLTAALAGPPAGMRAAGAAAGRGGLQLAGDRRQLQGGLRRLPPGRRCWPAPGLRVLPMPPNPLEEVTPLILTYNEEANVARVLARLGWARRIVVIDSGSTDATLDVLAQQPAVTVHQRPFDSHARQWNFGLAQVSTPWVLSLDADYLMPPELVAEIEAALRGPEAERLQGYWLRFRYCVAGRPLRGSILPPRLALFRRAAGHYVDDGHTQRLVLRGPSGQLAAPLLHDDRKPLSRWLWAQQRYVALEADKLQAAGAGPRRLSDRVRRLAVVAPPAVFLLCLLRGGLLDGWRGWFYALQRLYVETLLALTLLERRLRASSPPGG